MSTESSRVWFITGCSTGFGRALAEEVLLADDRLIATAREVASLDDLVASHPETLRVLSLDVTQPARVQEVVKEAAEVWGRLDVVVNNAGYGLIGALEE